MRPPGPVDACPVRDAAPERQRNRGLVWVSTREKRIVRVRYRIRQREERASAIGNLQEKGIAVWVLREPLTWCR